MRLPPEVNLRSCFLIHSSNKTPSVQLFLWLLTAQKMKFPIKDFFSKWPNTQFPADLVTFTEEILNGKLHFFCAVLHCWPVSFFSKSDSFHELIIWDHPFYSAHAKFSEKLTLRTLWHVHVRVRIRGTNSKFFETFCVCTKCMTPLWANSFKCNTVSTFPLSYPTIRSVKISDIKRFSILKGLFLNEYSTYRYSLTSYTKESHHDTLWSTESWFALRNLESFQSAKARHSEIKIDHWFHDFLTSLFCKKMDVVIRHGSLWCRRNTLRYVHNNVFSSVLSFILDLLRRTSRYWAGSGVIY